MAEGGVRDATRANGQAVLSADAAMRVVAAAARVYATCDRAIAIADGLVAAGARVARVLVVGDAGQLSPASHASAARCGGARARARLDAIAAEAARSGEAVVADADGVVALPLRVGARVAAVVAFALPSPIDAATMRLLAALGDALGALWAAPRVRPEAETDARDPSPPPRADDGASAGEAPLLAALASSPIALFRQDRDLRYTWVHAGARARLADAAVGKTDAQLFGVDASRSLTALKRRVLATGRARRRVIVVRLDGEPARRRAIDLLVWPLRGDAGEVVGVTGIAIERRAPRHREDDRADLARRLTREREWLRAVIDRAPLGVMLLEGGPVARVTVNARARELVGGGSARSAIARALLDACDEAGRPLPRDRHVPVRVMRGERVDGEDVVVHTPEGARRTLRVYGAPIEAPRGTIAGGVVLVEDVTALKALERQREEWTSLVVHDLKQPLHGMRLHTAVLLRLAPGGLAREAAEHVRDGIDRLAHMVADLQDASVLDVRRIELHRAPVDLASLVRDAVARSGLSPLVDLEVRGAPIVRVDRYRVDQVMGNLLSNAEKYGRDGARIRVYVACEAGAARVSVANEGETIDADELPRLFERFHRARRHRDGATAGLGLGLYVTRGLVEAHGGRVGAESVAGVTTFSFTLPRWDREPAADGASP